MQVTLEILNLIVATNLIGSYYFKDIYTRVHRPKPMVARRGECQAHHREQNERHRRSAVVLSTMSMTDRAPTACTTPCTKAWITDRTTAWTTSNPVHVACRQG